MLLVLLLVLLAMIFIGLPVLLAMGLVGLMGFLAEPALVLPLFPQKMFATLDSFSLLALPYFILAGELMAGGISRKLVEFAQTLVGHLRGGLSHAAIVTSMLFAGISGSSTADTSAIGSVLIPAMKENGYKAGFAASVTAVGGTIGAIIPPSMTMIVYGALANVSIGGLFLGGIVPGILVGLALMSVVYLHARNSAKFPELQARKGRFEWRASAVALVKVWSALLAPLIIVGGILGGVFTATEAGVVACLYSFLVSVVFYRTIRLRELPGILLDAALTTCMVSGIIGIAGAFGWLLAYLDFNNTILGAMLAVSHDPLAVFAMLIAVMLVLTMFIDSMAVMIIMVPIAVFIGARLGLDQFQLGVAIVMATQIGATTPPVAVLLFVSSSIARCSYAETIRYVWPFIGAEIVVLALVMLIPPLASQIPNWAFGN